MLLDCCQGEHNGQVWYERLAARAVGQCIGRAVRNDLDYGCVVLADPRYGDYPHLLPSFVRASVTMQVCSTPIQSAALVKAKLREMQSK